MDKITLRSCFDKLGNVKKYLLYYFLWLFLPFYLTAENLEINFPPKYELSICTIFQNDAPYLKEWIEFHKLQGVEHFYLYNNLSKDDYLNVLSPYVSNREVTLIEWPFDYDVSDLQSWGKIQNGAYNDCINAHRDETIWLAVIDSDEFLFCPNGKKLTDFLENYLDMGGVCANWLCFGTSYIEDVPEGVLMIEALVRCIDQDAAVNQHIKSIVQPKYVSRFYNPHCCSYTNDRFAVNVDKEKVDFAFSKISLDQIRINHYWTRTERYFSEYKIPSRNKRRNLENVRGMAQSMNEGVDDAILRYVPMLKEKMK